MLVTETNADGLSHEFKVVVDAKEIEARVEDRLVSLRETVRMPGFRPGKVPLALLKRQYGKSILGEVLEQAVSQTSSQALAEKGLRPATQPKIEITSFDEGGDLEYTMAVEAMPEIKPADFREYKLVREVVEIGDGEVDDALARLAEQHKSFAPIETKRAAKKGDALLIDFVGKIDGELFEGGSSTDHLLELGSSSFIEGFEDQLIGAKAGDHCEVKLTFPEDYPAEHLAGKEAVFDVDVKEIQEPQKITPDDAFAQSLGFNDLAALRQALKEQIERDYGGLTRTKLKRVLLDKLAETHDFPVPPGMLEAEFDSIWERVEADRKEGKLDEDDAALDEDELREEYRRIAERRVRLGLLLSETGRMNGITVGEDEINRAMMERARQFPGQEERVIEYFRQNPEAVNEIRAPLFEDKVIDFILEMAEVEERKVTVEELLALPESAGGKKKAKAATKSAGTAKAKSAAKSKTAKDKAAPKAKKPEAKKKAAPKSSDKA